MKMKTLSFSVLFLTIQCRLTASTHYVDISNPTPAAPYASWGTAANNIQDAVDASVNGDTVMVTNGHYVLSSEIRVTKDITIQSVAGAQETLIDGNRKGRCFNLGSARCVVSGFTIKKGYIAKGAYPANAGGGVNCTDLSPVVKDCIISGNTATHGGGMHWGIASNCTFISNAASNYGGGMRHGEAYNCSFNNNAAGGAGGMDYGTAFNCTFSGNAARSGGGMTGGTANNCTFNANSASAGGGGGMDYGTANNCLFVANRAVMSGGGLANSKANNCTIVLNIVSGHDYGGWGGGMFWGVAKNCIVWGNYATAGGFNLDDTMATRTCSTDVIHGVAGNISRPPLFVNSTQGDYRLKAESPCINAGKNTSVVYGADLDGYPRIIDGTVDMGAYEYGFQGCSITGFVPSGDASVIQWTAFPMWESSVYWATNLTTGFQPLETGIEYPQNSCTDTVHTVENQCFYQVQVQLK